MAEDVVYGTRSETVLMSRQGSVLSVCVGVCSFQSLLLVGHSFCGCVWKHDVSCVNCCRDHHC